MKGDPNCRYAEGFRLHEKIFALTTFLLMGIAGTIAIWLEDWRWVPPYLVVYWYGIPGVVIRHLNCPRCQHLHVYGDCLQFPARITKRLVKAKKDKPFSLKEKCLFCFIFVFIPIYPLFFMASHRALAVVFILSAIGWYAGQLFHFCRHCRVVSCPFNRVPKSSGPPVD